MGNPVVHFQLCSKDVDAMSAFYRDVFGWRIAPRRLTSVDADVSGMYPTIEAEEGGIAGGITDRIPAKGGAVLVDRGGRRGGHDGAGRAARRLPAIPGKAARTDEVGPGGWHWGAVRLARVRGSRRQPGRDHPAMTTARIPSTASGFSRLERSPGSSPVAAARIARRTILALRVLGSSSTKSTFEGANDLPS